jgi:thiamine transporter
MKERLNIGIVIEGGVMVALAGALNLLSLAQLPNAGRISLEMLPIYYFAIRRGFKAGMLSGFALGIIIMIFDPRFIHPAQVILDYPLPNMLVGLAGLFPNRIWLGVIVGGASRFLSHFVSGIVFFGSFAPQGTPVWLYSLIYNGSYIVPQIIIALILMPVIFKRIRANG